VPDALGQLRALGQFAEQARALKSVHFEDPELVTGLETLAKLADEASAALDPFVRRFGEQPSPEPAAVRAALFPAPRPGAVGVLRDLQALEMLAESADGANTAVSQAAKSLRAVDFVAACAAVAGKVNLQQRWLHNEVLHRAAHTLTVPN
jgi:hypothetical protein